MKHAIRCARPEDTIDNIVIAYAYAHHHMERAAYAWNAELSIYVDKDYHKQGIGRKLYAVLIEVLKLQNIVNLYACITVPNEKSIALHHHFGFRQCALFPNTGYKFNAWHSIIWMELALHESISPQFFIPISQLDEAQLKELLNRFQ